ncbi:hypothetical protein B0T24DRAFT_526237 [Lasiosphaeria ovina]|uniref:Uncharacterized protein n=1 Tax=Lasiosphaeria ovina TaxID=92902 RepID=A0AAE0NAM7_9PEZI|nr:hypothetical protein B0T24DRAFT_526237 [Lasiosphaeria ovina]
MSSAKDLWWAKQHPPADPTHLSFKDRAVLVTGANSGLGHEAAVKYAAQGASPLILAVRSQEKGEQAKAAIIARTSCKPDIFLILTVDMSTFASVRAFADQLNAAVPALHVAQLAAGVATFAFSKSPEGYESALQVNVLSTALLALLLLPKLRATAAAEAAKPEAERFVPHLSFVHSIASMEVTDADIPADQSLVQRIDDQARFDNQRQYFLFFLLGRSVEEGSRSLVSATGLGVESHGKFWRNDSYAP